MIGIAGGNGKNGFWIQQAKKYNKQASHNYNLDRCKTYGITVTNQVVGNDTISNLYIANISVGESSAKLVMSHKTVGGAAYAVGSDNRIGNRIDHIKSPCGQCCPKGSAKVIGQTITRCVSVN